MKNIVLYFVLCLTAYSAPTLLAQTPQNNFIKGLVTNEKEELLIGATISWKDTTAGTIADTAGRFSIIARTKRAILVVKYFGYNPVEVEVLPGENNLWIEVRGANQLKQVTIEEQSFGNSMSTLETRNVESIGHKELRKAPCCNLSESFETNGAIDVSYSNAITGVKEIQLLGLRGIYSQFLIENRPTMTGIAAPFAFEFIPGTWLNGIVLAKGASSVKNGNNGITGQINTDLVKPQSDKPLFINAFTSTEGRGELNVHLNNKGKNNLSNGLLLHGDFAKNRWDRNKDNFYDSPNRYQLNALYRAIYDGPAGCAQFNIMALSDHRKSGQINELATKPGLFSVDQQNDRVEVWSKYGKEGLFGKPYNEIGNIVSASWHRTNSVFGNNTYYATQQSFFAQSLFQTILGNSNHKMVIAPSLQYDDIQEKVNEGDLSRKETVAGAMVEYTYSHPTARLPIPDFVMVLGARLDYNSRFGWLPTPRMSAKYNFTENTIVRVSGGLGYRSPNLISENISLLASNRSLDFAGNLRDEKAWNYGMNFTQNFKIARRNASVSIDAYRTDFVRQIMVDVDKSPTTVYFYQINGQSFSNSVLAVFQYNIIRGLELKLAGKWNDVRATYQDGILRALPLVAKHRGLVTLDYTTPNKKWMFNLRTQIVGPQRLPDNSKVPHKYIHDFPEVSPTYSIWSGQVTRSWKKFEIYAGLENFSNFQQHHAIIAAAEPWSPYFNGSQLWAPMMGRVVNMGVRFAPAGL
jgi:outer membrane receptor for ferrienterochelin and colicins